MLTKKLYVSKNNLINLFISLLPLSLILGNLATNINIVLICVLGGIIYKSEIFKINKKKYQYLLYAFFSYVILITLFNNLPNLNNSDLYSYELYEVHIIKSFFFLRFLILFLVVNKLFEKNDFNLNFFFISCSFFAFIISIDLVVQMLTGENIIGLKITNGRVSSFFGDENIAGSYVQKFSLFFIFLFAIYQKKYQSFYIILSLFFFFFFIVLITANKMSALLFFTSLIIFLIISKKIKHILVFFLLFLVFSFSLIKYNQDGTKLDRIGRLSTDYNVLYDGLKKFTKNESFESNRAFNDYKLHFNTGLDLWKESKVLGSGIKSFRLKCTFDLKLGHLCNTHPHNYTIEILLDLGIIGLSIIYLIFIFAVVDFFKYYKTGSSLKLFSLPFFLIVFLEFFPIRSSGSFFTTSNAAIIFFMLAGLIGCCNFKNLK